MLLAVPGAGALLDGLAAYTARHMARLDRLRRATALLDYTLGAMRVVAPDQAAVHAGADDGAALAEPQACAPAERVLCPYVQSPSFCHVGWASE